MAPGETPAIAFIPLQIEQAGGAPYAGAASDDPTLVTAAIQALSATTGRLVLRAVASHAPGTFKTTVRALACTDPRCANVVRSEAYPVSVTILPPLAAHPAAVSMAAVEGATAQLDVKVSTPGTGTLTATVNGATVGGWLNAKVIDGPAVRITTSAGRLAPGVLQSDVMLDFARSGGALSRVMLPVSFTIGKGLTAPAAQQLKLDAASTQASLSGAVSVRRTDDSSASWSAASSAAWLVLAPGSDSTPSTLGYSVDLAKASSLKNFADHTATVTISAGALTPVNFIVTLQKRLPYMAIALPYGIPVGISSRVVAGGAGFKQYPNLAASMRTDGLVLTNLQVISDTQIAFTVTPARGGAFTLGLPNASSAAVPQATLNVAANDPYAAATVVRDGELDVAVHDPVRQAIFAINRVGNVLVRFQHANGSWSVSAAAVKGPNGLAIAPDGKRVLVTTAADVQAFDPDTMQRMATYAMEGIGNGITRRGLAITADNRMWLPTSYSATPMAFLDLLDNTIGNLSIAPDKPRPFGTPVFAAAANGSTLVAGPDCCSTFDPWLVYDPATETLGTKKGWTGTDEAPQFSSDGSVVLREGRNVYRDDKLVGQVAIAASGFMPRIALSPDGSRIYSLGQNEDGLRIAIYSTSSFSAGTNFALVGSIPIVTRAANCRGNDHGCDPLGNLVPSADQKTLFWVGNRGMQVYKLP